VLDVWNNEPVPHPTTIAVCDIATPHIAGYSYDGKLCGTAMIYEAASAFFFKERAWVSPVPVSEQLTVEKSASSAEDIVLSAIMAAYPIMDDDARFRKILDIDISKRAEYFDKLRRDYPKRMEFSHYYLNGDAKSHEQSVAFLLNMGFKVNLQ
jgi:erythronate-4-phosphate dehydrogenase